MKLHVKSASFSTDNNQTSRFSFFYGISNDKNFIPKYLDNYDNSDVIATLITTNFHLYLMYQSNRGFNIPPPGQLPGHLTFLKIIVQIPPPRAKMLFKYPTRGSIRVTKCPHPGDISQAHEWQKDGKNAFSCRTKSLQIQQIIRIQYNKNWQPL